jgi:hypothetical protein
MRKLLALVGGIALGAWLARLLRPASRTAPVLETDSDPRAEELREKLVEARETLPEREAFEEAETPVDEAEPAAGDDLDERRAKLHERGHAVAGEMRGGAKPKPSAETED